MKNIEVIGISIDWLTIAGVVIFICVALRIRAIYKHSLSRQWRATKAIVISITINKNQDNDDGDTYYPSVMYKYKMPNGVTNITSKSFYSGVSFSDVSAASRSLNGLKEGQEIIVLFDPKNPYESVMEISNDKFGFAEFLLLCMGIALLIFSSYSS